MSLLIVINIVNPMNCSAVGIEGCHAYGNKSFSGIGCVEEQCNVAPSEVILM